MGLFDRLFHKDTAESADNKKTKGNEMENKLNFFPRETQLLLI